MWMRPVFCLVSLLLVTAAARADDLGTQIEARLGAGFDGPATEEEFETLAVVDGFYRARDMRPIWVGEAGALPRARQMADLLLLADRDGLVSGDYGAAAVGPLLTATDLGRLADLEVRLSLGLVQFVADLGEGRTAPNVADPELFPYRDKVDKPDVLVAAATAADLAELVDRYRPHSPRYDRLRQALADYRAIAELGGWEAISEGPTLKPEMTDPRIGAVRSRLLLWGDLSPDADLAGAGGDPDFYDEALVTAVERVQYRHGLEQDGLIGRGTLGALNVPVEDRIDQIVLNLERRRWLPDDLGRRYVFVNLADFNLKVVDGERTIHDTRVVVGLPYRRTPVFSEEISYLELNPYWHVPPSIARRDILPRLQSDPGYLAANNYTLFSDWSAGATVVDPLGVDWSEVTPRRLRLQDPAGARGQQRAGTHQVHVPQPVQHLSARHAGEIPVQQGRAQLQLRMHPGHESAWAGRGRARRDAGLGPGADRPDHRDRCADRCVAGGTPAGASELPDGDLGQQGWLGAFPLGHL